MRVDPRLVANFVLFQVGWLVAVVGAAWGYPAAGIVYALVWGGFHHWRIQDGRQKELLLVVGGAVMGFIVDSVLVLGGVIAFPPHAQLGYPSTLWMASLWAMFAMTLRYSLGWLRGQYLLAAALGAIGGPLAYLAGSKLGAVELDAGLATLGFIALAWVVSMICLLRLELLTRFAGRRERACRSV